LATGRDNRVAAIGVPQAAHHNKALTAGLVAIGDGGAGVQGEAVTGSQQPSAAPGLARGQVQLRHSARTNLRARKGAAADGRARQRCQHQLLLVVRLGRAQGVVVGVQPVAAQRCQQARDDRLQHVTVHAPTFSCPRRMDGRIRS